MQTLVKKSLIKSRLFIVPIIFVLGGFFFASPETASAAQICAYVADDGKYACITGSEPYSDCSGVSVCDVKGCQRIDSAKCGQRAFNYACVASDGKYACSPGNKADCSDTNACQGRGCVKIDPAECGQAAGDEGGGGEEELLGVDLTIDDVGRIITGIACWTLSVILAVMVIAVVVAGLRFFLSRGEPSAVTAARKNLLWVLVGIAVILGVNVIIATIAYYIGADYSFLPLQCKEKGERSCNIDEDCIRKYGKGYGCVETSDPKAPKQCARARVR